MNLRVGSLPEILIGAEAPLWMETSAGPRQVKTVQRNANYDRPDLTLKVEDIVLPIDFNDQRVHLDLNTGSLKAKDVDGKVWTILVRDCVPA